MGMFTAKNRTGRGKRWVSALLTLALVCSMLPVTAFANGLTDRVSVQITTGEMSGAKVGFLGLKYRDVNGIQHVEYLFPNKDGLVQTLDKNRDSMELAVAARESALKSLGYLADVKNYKNQKALQPYSTDTYVFELPFEINQDDPNWFQGLEVYCKGDTGSTTNTYSWDVQGVQVFTGGSAKMYITGGINEGYTLVPYGNLAYTMAQGGRNLTWDNDRIFEFGPGSRADVSMKSDVRTVEWNGSNNFYTFRIDFADIYGGGIETLAQKYNSKEQMRSFYGTEALVMEVQYMDVWGDVIRVDVPVVNSMLATMHIASTEEGSIFPESFLDMEMLGIAQQGESIAFSACLPNMQKISRITFYSGDEISKRNVTGVRSVVEDDSISITNVSVYNGVVDAKAEPHEGNGAILHSAEASTVTDMLTFRSKPLFYHTAASYTGEVVPRDSSLGMVLSEYVSGSNLTPMNRNERYLVELKGTKIGFYEQPEDIYLQIKYRTVKGEERETSKISVRSAVDDFYGYWPASDRYFAYKTLMYEEGSGDEFGGVKFIIELRDVEHFSGITLDTGSTQRDWQMKGIQISRLRDVSPRVGQWEEISMDGIRSDRRYDRDVAADVIFTMNETVLVQPGEQEEMDFTSGSVVTTEDVVWNDVKYAMSFDESCSDFGFVKSREKYTVEVKVSGDAISLEGNGDSGSKNKFFFQLEFEQGSSGYVLANQQLGADGFRSGFTETFTITTNRDYGELVAVRIIPEDTTEDSDIYDKLNIEEIKVRRNSTDSIARQWTVSEVGWIGIDYRDEGASVSIGGQEGRTEAEIAQVYPVTYRSYGVNLLFNINTGSYESAAAGANTQQFRGTVGGVLWYTNSMGEMTSYSFDLVEAIYKYANRDPVYGKNADGTSTMAVSDPNYMFRGNHTDRFILSVDDIVKVNHLELNVVSTDGHGTTWTIDNIAVQQILSDGVLQISENDEYVRTNETKPLCANEMDANTAGGLNFYLSAGERQTHTVYFQDNLIEVDKENFTWVSTVSREPASENDELNVYVYPVEGDDTNYEVNIGLTYTNTYGSRWHTGAEMLSHYTLDGQEVFGVQGLSAKGMSSLNKVIVEANTGREVMDALIDHVVVQQVRNGVVIKSYYLEANGASAFPAMELLPDENIAATTESEQVVMLALDDSTVAANLVPETRDLAVALRYTSLNEDSGREYQSRYVFLTDDDYRAIESGSIISIPFEEDYVRDVTGISLVSTGRITAGISCAGVALYEVSDGAQEGEKIRKQTGWYSFADSVTVSDSTVTMQATPDRIVKPLEITFTTSAASGTGESGTDSPVALRIGYRTNDNSDRAMYLEDARKYVTSGQEDAFKTGTTTTVKMLVSEVKDIRWIEIEPYDEDESRATLKLDSIELLLDSVTGKQQVTRTIADDVVFEEGAEEPYRVNCSKVSVEFMINVINPDTGRYEAQPYTAKSTGSVLKVITKSGGGAKIGKEQIQILDSTSGYTIKTELVTDGAVSPMDHLTTASGSEWVFAAPENKTSESMCYRITVASAEIPEIAAVAEITVLSEPTSLEDIVQDIVSSGGGSSGDSGSSSSGSADAGTSDSGAGEDA